MSDLKQGKFDEFEALIRKEIFSQPAKEKDEKSSTEILADAMLKWWWGILALCILLASLAPHIEIFASSVPSDAKAFAFTIPWKGILGFIWLCSFNVVPINWLFVLFGTKITYKQIKYSLVAVTSIFLATLIWSLVFNQIIVAAIYSVASSLFGLILMTFVPIWRWLIGYRRSDSNDSWMLMLIAAWNIKSHEELAEKISKNLQNDEETFERMKKAKGKIIKGFFERHLAVEHGNIWRTIFNMYLAWLAVWAFFHTWPTFKVLLAKTLNNEAIPAVILTSFLLVALFYLLLKARLRVNRRMLCICNRVIQKTIM